MMRKALIIACLTLAACGGGDEEEVVQAPMLPDVPLPVGPLLTAAEAFAEMDAICTGTLPDFAGTDVILAARGFTEQRASGALANPLLDASVMVTDDTCSLAFGTSDERTLLIGELSLRGPLQLRAGSAYAVVSTDNSYALELGRDINLGTYALTSLRMAAVRDTE